MLKTSKNRPYLKLFKSLQPKYISNNFNIVVIYSFDYNIIG